jgi:predicted nucleic acid-binding protein
MKALLDPNVVLRDVIAADPQHPQVRAALQRLIGNGWDLCLAPQNLIQFWVVATRPPAVNGLGLTPDEVREKSERLMQSFLFLPDPADLIPRWLRICHGHAVLGRQAHDARLVPFMQAHAIDHLITLNESDFARYGGITCLRPQV